MSNNRIIYPSQQVGFAKLGAATYIAARGVQTAGMNVSLPREAIFQLSESKVYENLEGMPEVEVSMEKVLDGNPPLLLLATNGAASASLFGRAPVSCQVAMSYFPETFDSASGLAIAEVRMSGLFWSSSSFTFPVDGTFNESLTLVGNHRKWYVTANSIFSGQFDNTSIPLATTLGSGGIQRREDLVFDAPAGLIAQDANGQVDATKLNKCTILPKIIQGISSSGINERIGTTPNYKCSVQNISVSCEGGREDLNELGHKAPYYKFLNIPVTVSCDIETINKSGDWIDALETGAYENGNNSPRSTIKVATRDGLFIDLGTENRLVTVAVGGGGTDGGNSTLSYSFETENFYTVTHDQDPTSALR